MDYLTIVNGEYIVPFTVLSAAERASIVENDKQKTQSKLAAIELQALIRAVTVWSALADNPDPDSANYIVHQSVQSIVLSYKYNTIPQLHAVMVNYLESRGYQCEFSTTKNQLTISAGANPAARVKTSIPPRPTSQAQSPVDSNSRTELTDIFWSKLLTILDKIHSMITSAEKAHSVLYPPIPAQMYTEVPTFQPSGGSSQQTPDEWVPVSGKVVRDMSLTNP
jgi:hypothetical protein